MASKASRFAARADTVHDSLAAAAAAPADVLATGVDRLAAARALEQADIDTPETAATVVGEPESPPRLTVAPTVPQESPAEAGPADVADTDAQVVRRATPRARRTTPTRSPSPAWDPETLVTPQPAPDAKPRTARVTYTAPPGLLERLKDLDVRSRLAGYRTVHRDALVAEAARRVAADPEVAAAALAAYGWTKGEGQLQPRLPVELSTEVTMVMARLERPILDVGPVVGVITEQVAREFDSWLRGREADL